MDAHATVSAIPTEIIFETVTPAVETPTPTASMSPSLSVSPLPTATISGVPGEGIVVNPCPTGSQFAVLCNWKVNQTGDIVSSLVSIAMIVAVILSLFALLWGGIRWIISGGDKAKVDAARNTVLAAIVGLIVVFLSYYILTLVLGFFGLSLKELQLPPLPRGQ
jgi:hypothetical protein